MDERVSKFLFLKRHNFLIVLMLNILKLPHQKTRFFIFYMIERIKLRIEGRKIY